MRVITANVNGIRAAARKGFFDWMKEQDADVICMQETKAQLADLSDPVFSPEGYHRYLFDAERKGYSGVAIYTREEPVNVIKGLGWGISDTEGRHIQIDFPSLSVVSLYLPSGTGGSERQQLKYDFMERYEKQLQEYLKADREFIICGDWNIVHKEIDIKNFKSNQKTSGCLPEERAWLDKIFTELDLVDAFREVNQKAEQYTWWSNRGRARENNVGWRIDYQILSPGLRGKVKQASVFKERWFSDHAPLTVDYDIG